MLDTGFSLLENYHPLRYKVHSVAATNRLESLAIVERYNTN
ncbi:MAG: hypothetical protein ACYS17_16995 [Planctomycetota bacterium]